MGLTERHWFENEDVPENYEWALEDAVCNSCVNKKHDNDIVRCKDCVHNGKVGKCVLAAIAEEKGYPLFMLDNCGEWFCADGKRK